MKNLFLLYNANSFTLGGRSMSIGDSDEWDSVHEMTKNIISKQNIKPENLILSFDLVDTRSLPRLIDYIKYFRTFNSGNLIWKYQQEDMKELGEDLESALGISFGFNSINAN